MIEWVVAYGVGALCTGIYCGFKQMDFPSSLYCMSFWPVLVVYIPYGIGRMYAGKGFIAD